MKTAMQKLKERLVEIGFTGVEPFIDEYIEKEKKQIIDAVKYGFNDATRSSSIQDKTFEEYYTKTFEKK